jgi:peptidoglycan/LPS O-acetylase OafA/YrhL
MSAPPTHLPSRLRGIDALRGAAALGVVFYHAVEQGDKALPNNLFQYPARVVQFASSFGYIGVFLFFVISGFCIHLQWARAKAADVEPDIRFGTFWKRRIRRLYPPYIITLLLFLLLTASTVGIDVTRFFIYDLGMHVLMLHNLDPHTCYTINGVFWTLAVEEQLYLAYFLLLFIRVRWGWSVTLAVCLFARLAWMGLSHVVWLKTGFGIPVPEAAASHWFTWALGALGVEVFFGMTTLRGWSRDLRLATVLIIVASALSTYLPWIPKDTLLHHTSWFLIHPLWGLGFFIVVNRTVLAEQSWLRRATLPSLVSIFSTLGIFSYSIYLTHELVIMLSWQWVNPNWWQLANVFMAVVPATIIFAWVFFWFCEKPFMVKSTEKEKPLPALMTQPSAVGD